jgi:antitoxin StbD
MTEQILTNMAASITELKQHPLRTVNSAHGDSIAILSNNKPVFYCVPSKMYETIMNAIDDMYLVDIVKQRQNERSVRVDINDL